ncbi:MAG: TetR/AcrR family transcriptional regulator [Planctomycetes bacterium]|nr:TetR/AcrR family transcriptional regulator [Planctomycetota bacterium]
MPRTSNVTEQPFENGSTASHMKPTHVARDTYDERQTHILEAATLVMARDGYQRATMRSVAREADVSIAGIYHYFDSKEKLLFVIQFRAFTSLLANLRERIHGIADPVEQLHLMVRSHVGYFATKIHALKVCSHELDSLTGAEFEEIRELRLEYYRMVRAIVDRVFGTYASGSRIDPHVATMSLFGMLNWLYRWYDPSNDRSHSNVAHQITTQFLEGITGEGNGDRINGSSPTETTARAGSQR